MNLIDWFTHSNSTELTSTGSLVCDMMKGSLPNECSCSNTATGGTVKCSVTVSSIKETLKMQVDMNVCSVPMSIAFSVSDQTGASFKHSFSSGDSGSIPTGLGVVVPGLGSGQLYLDYVVKGPLDALYMKFGFDAGVVAYGYTTYCSTVMPTTCPVWFMDETVDFSDSC